jgi:hypothetical protein
MEQAMAYAVQWVEHGNGERIQAVADALVEPRILTSAQVHSLLGVDEHRE